MAASTSDIAARRKAATDKAAEQGLGVYKDSLKAAIFGMQEKSKMDDLKRTNARLGDAGQLGQ